MLAQGEETRNMQPFEFLGNLILLIVGGNDTTRNSISGGVLALNQIEWLWLFYAAARIGVGVVGLSTRYRDGDLAHMLTDSGAKAVFTVGSHEDFDFIAMLGRLLDAGREVGDHPDDRVPLRDPETGPEVADHDAPGVDSDAYLGGKADVREARK
jgi:acyl-CoA synthetase (AMP-forming)/AMP-acid ligase II